MELDDLKNAWDDAGKQEAKQPRLTSEMIEQIIQKKYHSKIKKITYPEISGVIVCLISAVFIGVNFSKLDTILLQGAGIVSILLLLALSVISLLSLRQLDLTADAGRPYAETLRIFAIQKLQFYKLQKLNITLCNLLIVAMIVLLSKIFNGRDMTGSKYFWLFSFTFGYIFLTFFSGWVSKFYKKTLSQSEELLQELQS